MRNNLFTAVGCAILLGACGGGGDDAGPTVNLQGLWYQQDASGLSAGFASPHVIVQNGQDVVIKNCDASTRALRLDGNRLLFTDGTPYPAQPTEEGYMGLGYRAAPLIRRFSTTPLFDSGRVSLGLTNTALQASQDVCAERVFLADTGVSGVNFKTIGIAMTAPYLGSHVRVRLAFASPGTRPFTPLETGTYTVRDQSGFALTPENSVHVAIQSPAFAGSYGGETLAISGGQLRMESPARDRYTLDGTLTASNGAVIPFSADLTLNR